MMYLATFVGSFIGALVGYRILMLFSKTKEKV